VDALDLAGRDIPVIGFTGMEQLKDNFDIKMVPSKEKTSKEGVCLHLITKAGSSFKNDYRTILFWLDKEVWLPARIEATTVEGDIFRIRFIDSKVNQGIDDSIFNVKIPKGFNQPEIIPLNTQGGHK
jgi:outer membrane lipoprotein-sorting protein